MMQLVFGDSRDTAGASRSLGGEAYSWGIHDAISSQATLQFLKGQYDVGITLSYAKENIDQTRLVASIVPIARKGAGRLP